MTIRPYDPGNSYALAAFRQWLAECGYTVSAIEADRFTVEVDAQARRHVRYVASCYRCVVEGR